MIEDELRATFARHEHLAPAAAVVLQGVERGYRRRHQRQLVFRAGGAALAALVVIAGSAAGVDFARGRASHPVPAATTPPTPAAGAAVNLLVLGLDGDPTGPAGPAGQSRSDTVLIVHIPASHDRADVISIERDTRVSIPADPHSGYPGGKDKINTAYLHGGAELVEKTIAQNWGIRFDAAAVFTYQGLQRMVDAMGGVDLYVDADTTSIFRGSDRAGRPAAPFTFDAGGAPRPVPGVTPVVYRVGVRHLTGVDAIDYARQRMIIEGGGGAYARDRHVRQLVNAVVTKLMSTDVLHDPHRLAAVMQAAGDGGAVLDVGATSLGALGMLAGGVRTIVGIGVPGTSAGGGGVTYEVPTPEGTALLAAVRDGTIEQWISANPRLVDVTR